MPNFLTVNPNFNVSTQQNTYSLDFYPLLLANGLQVVTGAQQVVQNLLAVLSTPLGSIYRARTLGTTLSDSLFDQMDDETLNSIANTISTDLANSLPGMKFVVQSITANVNQKVITFTILLYLNNQIYTVTQNINLSTYQIF